MQPKTLNIEYCELLYEYAIVKVYELIEESDPNEKQEP